MAKMTMAEKLAARVKPLAEETTPAGEVSGDVNLLQPASEVPVAPEIEQETVPAAVVPPPTVVKTASAKKRKTPEQSVSSVEATSAAVQLILELPDSVDRRLQAYRAQTKKSHTVVLYDAVESTIDKLPELIREELGLEEGQRPSRLFERSNRLLTPVATEGKEPTVTHSIRVTSNNRREMTDLAERLGAPSRNFMLLVAYKAFLPEI